MLAHWSVARGKSSHVNIAMQLRSAGIPADAKLCTVKPIRSGMQNISLVMRLPFTHNAYGFYFRLSELANIAFK